MTHKLVPFVVGVLFAIGLTVGGMTQPAKVIGFLDFSGNWDPSLAFVMGGAVSVYAVAFRLIMKRPAPVVGGHFGIPTRRSIDWRLMGGAALFGVGWGLGGYCPGPGLTAAGSGSAQGLLFAISMAAGMLVAGGITAIAGARRQRHAEGST